MSCEMDQTTSICYLYLYFPFHYNIIFRKSQAIWAKKFLKRKELDRKSQDSTCRGVKSTKTAGLWKFLRGKLDKIPYKKTLFFNDMVFRTQLRGAAKLTIQKSLIILYNYKLAYGYFLVNLLWNSVQISCQKCARDFLYYILLLISKFIVITLLNDVS